MKAIIKTTYLATTLMALSPLSYGALNIYADHEKPQDILSESEIKYGFTQNGLSEEVLKKIEGEATDMPLKFAMEIIVPNDNWKVKINNGADNVLVTWKGNNFQWPKVLDNMSKDNNLLVDINWNKKIVEVVSIKHEQERMRKLQEEFMLAEALNNENLTKEQEAEISKVELVKEELIADSIIENSKLESTEKNNSNKVTSIAVKDITEEPIDESFRTEYENSNVLYGDGSYKEYVQNKDSKIYSYDEAVYVLRKNLTLRENLRAWANSVEDWNFFDKSTAMSNYTFDYDIKIKGKLIPVVRNIVSKYKNSDEPLNVQFYVNDMNDNVILLVDYVFKN